MIVNCSCICGCANKYNEEFVGSEGNICDDCKFWGKHKE